MHVCEVCGMESDLHPEDCYEQGCEPWKHWPPLCCSGCPCLSFEEAHGLLVEEAA